LRPEGYEKEMPGYTPRVGEKVDFEGLVTRINRLYRNKERTELSEAEEAFFARFMIDEVCGSCRGTRLKPHRNHVHVSGYSFYDLGNLELEDLRAFMKAWRSCTTRQMPWYLCCMK
jgi:excinuclease UvrABC ATPase subunit